MKKEDENKELEKENENKELGKEDKNNPIISLIECTFLKGNIFSKFIWYYIYIFISFILYFLLFLL